MVACKIRDRWQSALRGTPQSRMPGSQCRDLTYDVDSHASRSPFDHADGMFDIACVEICHLLFGDLLALSARDGCDLVFMRHTRTFSDSSCLFQQRGRGRALCDKVEAAIVVYRNDHGDRGTCVLLGAIIKRLNELPKVYTKLTKRRTHGRCGSRLSTRHLELSLANKLLCHL